MNENEFSRQIRSTLASKPVSAKVEKRLASAREAALAAASFESRSPLALAGHRTASFWRHHHAASAGVLVLLIALLIGAGWQWQRQRAAEQAVDVQLLADELPLEAFLTDSFDTGARP